MSRSDIELANQLAHEVLGRTLDELPPQTRKLLSLVYDWVKQQCDAEKIKQRDFRFSRRDIRGVVEWSDTALKVHISRLVEMEYLLVHRGGRGQSFDYELTYQGEGSCGERFFNGLNVTKKTSPTVSGQGKMVSSQGLVSPWSGCSQGGSQVDKNAASTCGTVDIEDYIEESTKRTY